MAALDVGSGSGALALEAAAAGADSVVAAEVHPGLVAAARRCAAENGLGHKVRRVNSTEMHNVYGMVHLDRQGSP